MNKLLVSLFISMLFIAGGDVVAIASTPGSRMFQGVAGPDQEIKQVQGLPVIISKRNYYLYLMPESMFSQINEPVKFTLFIQNPTERPWAFSINQLKAYSNGKDLKILGPEKIVAEARKEFSREEYKINKEQAKALAPYVEQKMQTLRDNLLKTENIPPKGKIKGLIYIDIPKGSEMLTIEVKAPGETHKFSFKIIEL